MSLCLAHAHAVVHVVGHLAVPEVGTSAAHLC